MPPRLSTAAGSPAAKLKENEKLLLELFKDDFAGKGPVERLELSAKLLNQARETKDDDAALFVMLREGMLAAALGGNADLAIEAFNRRRAAFVWDFDQLYDELHKTETARQPAVAYALGVLYSYAAAEALTQELPDKALHFITAAVELAPQITDAKLNGLIKAEAARIKLLKISSELVAEARKRLALKPEDPAANLTVGKFLLARGETDKSIASFAKCNDSTFGMLAKLEKAAPETPDAMTKLGDAWFDAGDKKELSELKARLKERAAFWYEKAQPSLTGLAKLKIETRLKDLPHAEAAATSLVVAHFAALKQAQAQAEKDRIKAAETGTAVATIHNPRDSGVDVFNLTYRFERVDGTFTDWFATSIESSHWRWFHNASSKSLEISFIPIPDAKPETVVLEVNYTTVPKERIIAADGKQYHVHMAGGKVVVSPGKE